jgi:hypothetical protein
MPSLDRVTPAYYPPCASLLRDVQLYWRRVVCPHRVAKQTLEQARQRQGQVSDSSGKEQQKTDDK